MQPSEPALDSKDLEAVTDGGYFDNYGAASLLDLIKGLETIKSAPQGQNMVDLARDLKLVVIQITSDPSRTMGCLFANLNSDTKGTVPDFCTQAQAQAKPRTSPTRSETQMGQAPDWLKVIDPNTFSKIASAIIPQTGIRRSEPSVMDVLFQTRSVTGIEIAEQLRARTCELGGSYYHFAMTEAGPVPLRWALSSYSQDQLEKKLNTGRGAERFGRLVNELRSGRGNGQC